MNGAVNIGLFEFSLVYLLLIAVLIVMKYAKVDKMKILLIASVRMTVQLVLVGYLLTFIFEHPNPWFTVLFLAATVSFSIHRVLSGQKWMNTEFKIAVACSLALPGLVILAYFVCIIVRKSIFDAQYTIPLSGMVIGNAMTGMTLALKTFRDTIRDQRKKIDTLLYLGVNPQDILKPFVSNALETALLPTINSMLGMGIIFLPGMMTGQILSGTVPTTAIMYQIAIMIVICTAVCLSVFCALNLGYRTLYNERNQIDLNW